ncbi:uncharacterized protein [Coffea arabica]|uniref:Endonuclease/exonuclease/phosphatase domain-containing protein n=1 Tax=Coffea arabica TaxID=13443 RepID=A0ABM4V6W7_COFAR
MRAVVWNCRGVGSPLTVPQLKESIKLHSPSLVFLAETKKKKSFLNTVKQRIQFDHLFVVDPVGLASGLAVLWKKELLDKKVLFSSFTIELLIDDKEAEVEWWCVCVYASTDVRIRREQWKVIVRRSCLWGDAWAIMGDLNNITSNNEKWGGRLRSDMSFLDFKSFINDNELQDIGFEGVPWTWCNNWDSEGEVKKRIDRILGSRGWIRSQLRGGGGGGLCLIGDG